MQVRKMTIGNIFGSGTSPSPSTYYPLPVDNRQVLSERDGSGFGYGSPKRTKGKYKEKKHAAMSALTLLAFLFFLNILQNCLREQTAPIAPEVTMMMMLPAPQKDINGEQPKEEGGARDGAGRRKRSLLQFEPVKKEPGRRTKFIHDVRDVKYWPKGLSQVSDKEIEIQKLKTDNLRSFVRAAGEEEDWVPKVGPVPGLANQTEKIFGGKKVETGTTSVGTERDSYSTSTLGYFRTASPEYPYPYLKYPQNHRFRYNRYGYRRTGAKYSPNRRDWRNYHVREKYYPVAVVERREDEEDEFGFDVIKAVWKVLAGVAAPIARMVPALAKIGQDESQCYDLLVCEAHRIGKFMGPTAEIFASTFSTFLSWYLGEEKRGVLMDAVNSGRERKTCREQIFNCDQRAGGKSAITLFAQLLETKIN